MILNDLQRWTVHPVSDAVLETASQLVEAQTLRALDALQLATAIVVRAASSGERFRFIAADARLLQAAAAESFAIWNPAEAISL